MNSLSFPNPLSRAIRGVFLLAPPLAAEPAKGETYTQPITKIAWTWKVASSNGLRSLLNQRMCTLVIGVTEKQQQSGSLFCSMLYISPTDGLLGVHRKIKPTGTERVIWSEADGASLVVFQTKIGRLGGLICWENYMPLARMAMYQKGVEIYIAPTADARESWATSMQHIALEGRCFVLGCNQFFQKSMYPEQYQHWVKEEPEDLCRGGSVIVSPLGKIIAGPLYDQEGALVAELDLEEIIPSKLDFDVIGHYARNDIFQFHALNQPEIIVEKTVQSRSKRSDGNPPVVSFNSSAYFQSCLRYCFRNQQPNKT